MFGRRRERVAERSLAQERAHGQFLEQCLQTARSYDGTAAGEGARLPINLKGQERMLFTLVGAALIEPRRTAGHWQGRSQGVSVHVPGTKSMRYRVGASRGTFVRGEERPSPIDTGSFMITTQRAVFVGQKQTREWLWSKLIGVQHATDLPWTSIAVSNRQKTSGVLYDKEHEDLIRFFIDLAIARANGTKDEFVAELEREHAAVVSALAAAGPASSSSSSPSSETSQPLAHADAASLRQLAAPPAPAGWYRDPTGRNEQRYWDGSTWSEYVTREGKQASDPL